MKGGRGIKHRLGFTLVEMVTVIIVLGVLVLGVSSFVVLGTRIFIDSTSVEQVLGQSRFALERMTRELRNAVPNSIRLTSSNTYQCVEFVPIQASASYIDLPFVPFPASLTGTVLPPSQGINNTQQMLVYPLRTADIYASTPAGTSGRLFDVKEFDHDQSSGLVTFDRAVRFAESSPIKRYFMINGPLSYCFQSNGSDGTLWRYAGYGLQPIQPTPSTMTGGALMAEDITNNLAMVSEQPILLTPSTLVNNAMLQLTPRFSVNGQVFQYQHQVQVINVP